MAFACNGAEERAAQRRHEDEEKEEWYRRTSRFGWKNVRKYEGGVGKEIGVEDGR